MNMEEKISRAECALTRSDVNKLSITDFLDGINMPFTEQLGQVRYYSDCSIGTHAIKPFVVNIRRNQWKDKETGQTGQLFSLLKGIVPEILDREDKYEVPFRILFKFYKEQMNTSYFFPTVPIRQGKLNTMLVNMNAAYGKLARLGLSALTLSNYCNEMLIIDKETRKKEVQIAFPCDNREFYLFNGRTLRPLDEPSITTFGTKRKGQCCYVYENAIDFLAMSEIQHRNHADYFHKTDYHLIINGRQNLEQACQFLSDNPDFQEVLSFMPKNEEGQEMFKKLNIACKGTLIDYSRLYNGFDTLAGRLRPNVPSWAVQMYERMQKQESKKEDAVLKNNPLDENLAKSQKRVERTHSYGPSQTIILEGKKHKKHSKGNKLG